MAELGHRAHAPRVTDLPVGVRRAMQLPRFECSRRGVQCSYRCPMHPSCAVAGALVEGPNCSRSPRIGAFQSQISFALWGDCWRLADGSTASTTTTQPLASLGAPLLPPRFTAVYTFRVPIPAELEPDRDAASRSSREHRHERVRARFIAEHAITRRLRDPYGVSAARRTLPRAGAPLDGPMTAF